jgi:hypothetical protein
MICEIGEIATKHGMAGEQRCELFASSSSRGAVSATADDVMHGPLLEGSIESPNATRLYDKSLILFVNTLD